MNSQMKREDLPPRREMRAPTLREKGRASNEGEKRAKSEYKGLSYSYNDPSVENKR